VWKHFPQPSSNSNNPQLHGRKISPPSCVMVLLECRLEWQFAFVVLFERMSPNPQHKGGIINQPFDCLSVSTNEAHRVRNDIVFSQFTMFWWRSGIRDQHKRLAEHTGMPIDVFLVSRKRVRKGPTTMCHISGHGDQKRRRLTSCLINE